MAGFLEGPRAFAVVAAVSRNADAAGTAATRGRGDRSSAFNYCVGNGAPDPGDTINVSPIEATPDALVPLAMR